MKRFLAILICLSGILTVVCQKKNQDSISTEKIPVSLTPVHQQLTAKPVRTSGILSSSSEIKCSFKIGGIIDRIDVKEGDVVKEGTLIASLKLDEIQAQVSQAKSGYDKAQRDYERAKNLYADSVATLEQLQNAETGLNVAKSNMEVADFNLTHAQVFAPSNGRVLKKLAEENELIAPGSPVVLFGSSGAMEVRAGVTDREVVRIKVGDPATVQFDAYPDKSFDAEVREIAGAPDPMNNTFQITLQLTTPSVPLFDGFVGKVIIHPSHTQMNWIVPFSALADIYGSEAVIYSMKTDSTVQANPVIIHFVEDSIAAISEGLENADRIIVSGASYCSQDALVKVINE